MVFKGASLISRCGCQCRTAQTLTVSLTNSRGSRISSLSRQGEVGSISRKANTGEKEGGDSQSAPEGLFALKLSARRRTAEEIRKSCNRFPIEDSFDIGRGKTISGDEVLRILEKSATPERLDKVLKVAAGRTFSVVPVLEGIYDKGNIAAVCRTAEALGYGAIHSVKAADPRRLKKVTSGRTSMGAQKWLDRQIWDATQPCLAFLKAAGYRIVVTALTDDSVSLSDVDWTKPTAIVLGSEAYGVSDVALELADQAITIPMTGFVDSFNVSVAAGMCLWDAHSARVRDLGQHGDLDATQQRTLAAAMLLRHKGIAWHRKLVDAVRRIRDVDSARTLYDDAFTTALQLDKCD